MRPVCQGLRDYQTNDRLKMADAAAIPEVFQGSLLLVDGHAYAYRSFHAIGRLTAPDGTPTNAIFGFIKAMNRLREGLRPGWVAVVWDGGLAAERLTALPEYKSQRPPMPEALAAQLDGIQAWLEAAGYAWFCREGVEADDWIGALAVQASGRGIPVVIASSDKDFMQLVGPRVGLVNPADKTLAIWGEAEVRRKAGVGPEQVVDWLSLVGDSVDNIPGVAGVGPKTAADLLNRFGSVDGVYAHLGEVGSERIREALRAAEPIVRRNRDLIRLRTDLAVEFDDARLRPGPGDPQRLRALYERWGFRSLAGASGASGPRQGELL